MFRFLRKRKEEKELMKKEALFSKLKEAEDEYGKAYLYTKEYKKELKAKVLSAEEAVIEAGYSYKEYKEWLDDLAARERAEEEAKAARSAAWRGGEGK